MTPKERMAYDFIEAKAVEVNEKMKVISLQMRKLQEEYQKKNAEASELNEEFKQYLELQKKLRAE
jgi:predicted RNA-binding protein with RPS1 domain